MVAKGIVSDALGGGAAVPPPPTRFPSQLAIGSTLGGSRDMFGAATALTGMMAGAEGTTEGAGALSSTHASWKQPPGLTFIICMALVCTA